MPSDRPPRAPKRSREGLWTFARVTLTQFYATQVAQFVLLSGWLAWFGPESIGLAAGFIALSTLVTAVLDGGLLGYLVALPVLTARAWTALCTQQLLLGTGLGVAIAGGLLAGHTLEPLGGWLEGPHARTQTVIYAGLALCLPLVAVARARLQLLFRDFEAAALARMRWVGLLVKFGVAAGIALRFDAPESLLIGAAIALFAEHVLVVLAREGSFAVRLQMTYVHDAEILRIRSISAGDGFATAVRKGADVLILSLALPEQLLGSYVYVAKLLVQLREAVVAPLSAAFVQHFALRGAAVAKTPRGATQIGREYLQQIEMVGGLLTPALLIATTALGLLLPEFRADWRLTNVETQLIGAGVAIGAIVAMGGALLYGLGEVRHLMRWSVGQTAAYGMAYATIFGLGLEPTLWVVVAVIVATTLAQYHLLFAPLALFDGRAYARAVWPTLLLTGVHLGLAVLTERTYGGAATLRGLQFAALGTWLAYELWRHRVVLCSAARSLLASAPAPARPHAPDGDLLL